MEHSYSQYDIHYTSDNDHFIIFHLKTFLETAHIFPTEWKALIQVSVAVKRINSWNKHFPIIVLKAHNWALSFWPSINNRVAKYILKQFNKEPSDNLGLEHIQAATQGNIIGQEALMIHICNPLCSSTMSGLKSLQ